MNEGSKIEIEEVEAVEAPARARVTPEFELRSRNPGRHL
jgi:hypothetical protein